MSLLLAGCVSPRGAFEGKEQAPGTDPAMMASAAGQLAQAAGEVVSPSEETRAALERVQATAPRLPLAIAAERDPLEEKIVSFDMYDAKADQFLWAIAKDLGFNLIVEPKVLKSEKRASLFLNKVSAREALAAVTQLFDVSATRSGNTISVSSLEQKVFPVDLLASNVKLSVDSGGDVLGATGGEKGLQGSVRLGGEVGQKNDAFDAVLKSIETIVKDPEGAKSEDDSLKPVVTLDRRSQTLFVRAVPSRLRQVADFLAQMRAVRGRQLQIDMQIIDVSLSQTHKLGIDWSLLSNRVAAVGGSTTGALSSMTSSLTSGSTLPARSLVIPDQTVGSSSGGAGLALSSSRVSAVVNALRTFGNVKLVSNPTLRARSGEPAFVSVGTTYRYVSKVTATSNIVQGVVQTVYSTETNSLFSGLMVGMTPAIREDGSIELFVHPLQSIVRSGSLNLVALGGGNSVTLPIIDSKSVATTLSVRSGDLIVLGGLADQSSNVNNTGVPGLSDVPGLGGALDTNSNGQTSRELVILLKANLL
ncbi:pilus (MSHA type) biogenesis protein MshL [uncultured Pseudacidovorax sp.]|uniref:pilus (MSHA type) biogenesis protein MshL n=1 Tax=uncultured Pseudacidovorax sp. TaxID=679313 RepID=UPI0025E7FC5E|nr:pilus (MSHA type) biogenesis protein MshL [uncultured Pseudacidovorax sp.]